MQLIVYQGKREKLEINIWIVEFLQNDYRVEIRWYDIDIKGFV